MEDIAVVESVSMKESHMQSEDGNGLAGSGKKRTAGKRACIICGKKATSTEHVFPSALGGRRKNKGIYCHSHNNWFGTYVAVLQEQLALINARLEVQPDRGEAKPFVTVDKQGRRFELLGADVTLAPDLDRILDSSLDGSPHDVRLDPALVKSLQERAKKRGLTLDVKESSRGAEFHVEPISLHLKFGGTPAMRAVSYLAVTFVAHFWSEIARGNGLADIKAMIRSGENYKGDDHVTNAAPVKNFVQWASVEETRDLGKPHSVVGHTIAICVSNKTLVCLISLFGALRFKILLGDCDSTDKSVITHIDPLQTGFGSDWKIDRLDQAVLSKDLHPTSLAADVLESDNNQLAMNDLFANIQRVHLSREYALARPELEKMASLDSSARVAPARSFVQKRRQRILNLILHLANEKTNDPMGILVKDLARKIIEDVPKTETGLSSNSLHVLDTLSDRFAVELHAKSDKAPLSEEDYESMFNGGIGLFTAASFFLAPLMQELGINQ
jgi:hypothetical protein